MLEFTYKLTLNGEYIRHLSFKALTEATAFRKAREYTETVLQGYPYLIHPTELESVKYSLTSVK